jgi:thiol-disulfide isomerase/thioredoxin
MKTLLRFALAAALTCGALYAQKAKRNADGSVNLESEMPPDARKLALGDAAPDFHLKGIDGKFYSLADFPASKAPVLMVVFLSNHCPYSHAAERRLIPLAKEFADKGLAVVSINPNSPEGVAVTELGYSKYNDSLEEMVLYAKEQGFPFPYLYDGATQEIAKAYGCLATPHVFLFDAQRKLRYVGRVDDSRFEDVKTVKSLDARNAVVEMLAGKPVTVATTTVVGCSTKWNSKKGDIAVADEKWKAEPVDLAKIDAAGVAKLAKNDTNRYRLINVWATWCAPCVAEFPELVSLSRRLGNRDFEFISLSADDPKLESSVKKFLGQQHAVPPGRLKRILKSEGRTGTNFLYTDASTDDLVKALDPAWPGPLPHTVLIAPGGKIVWRHDGPVDAAALLAKILEEMGPYYTPDYVK